MAKSIKKYKCPFCELRLSREDLLIHVGDEHEELIPEDFSVTRYVFNYVNKRPMEYHGKCTECGKSTPFDDHKARYNRQCGSKPCHESYLRKFEKNMMRVNGVTRISTTAEGQEKMLANRKISGTYRFKNRLGIERDKTYTGSYELKALEFMDQMLNIAADDIMCPGPVMEYMYEGKKHFYIPDFLYVPYNLIIEVKDGGKRPNNRSMPEYRAKQIAKEKHIVDNTNYNYLRLTDNNLAQLLNVFIDLKMQLTDNTGERVIHVNEAQAINENLILNRKDLYKNVDKFESGEKNVLLVTGFSGSGKSTLAQTLAKKYKAEHFELDCLTFFLDGHLPLEQCEKYEPGLFDFIKKKDLKVEKRNDEGDLYKEYIQFLINWCKNHKDKKYIIEGLQIYEAFDPKNPQSYITSCPIVIKGTSGLVSSIRAAKRNLSYEDNNSSFGKEMKNLIGWVIKDNKDLESLKRQVNHETMNALMTGYIPGMKDTGSVYIVNYLKNNVFSGEPEEGYGVARDSRLKQIITRNKEGKLALAPENFLDDAYYNLFITEMSIEEFSEKAAHYMGEFVEEGFLYETVFSKKMYTYDQIQTEATATAVIDYNKSLEILGNITESYLKGKDRFGDVVLEGMDIGLGSDHIGLTIKRAPLASKYMVVSKHNPELFVEANEPDTNSIEARILEGLSYREEDCK